MIYLTVHVLVINIYCQVEHRATKILEGHIEQTMSVFVGRIGGLGANLDEVVEDPEALRVLAGLDIDEGADLGSSE